MKAQNFVTNIIIIIAILSISFLILEITYRCYCYIKYFNTRDDCALLLPMGYKDRMEYMLKPYLDFVSPYGVRYKANSMGLRTKEAVPKTGYRILALGDSFTFGQGEDAENSYPAQLEHLIKADVINAGVSGYNTEQEYELLKRCGLKYEPDLVILGFYPNDAEPQNAITRSPYLEMDGVRIWIWEFVKYRLNILFKKELFVLKRREYRLHEWEAFTSDDYKWKRDNCFENIRKMKNLLASKNIGFLVIIIPYPIRQPPEMVPNSYEDYSHKDVHNAISAFCKEEKIDVLDLYPYLKGVGLEMTHCGHYKRDGYEIMAKAIADYLKKRYKFL